MRSVVALAREGADVSALRAAIAKAPRGDVDALDEDGFAALHHVALLLPKSPPPSSSKSSSAASSFSAAAELVDALVGEGGAAVDVRNVLGETPLHVAARHANAPVVERLLAHGADPRARTPAGRTPLDALEDPPQRRQSAPSAPRRRRFSSSSAASSALSSSAPKTKPAVAAVAEAERARCVAALHAALAAPSAAEVLAAEGRARAAAGDAAAALDAYARAEALSPRCRDFRAHADVAGAHLRLGRAAAALGAAGACTRLEPGVAEGWLLLARAQMHVRDFARARVAAEEGLRRCAERDPHARDLLRVVALCVERGVPPRPVADPGPARAALARLQDAGGNVADCAYCLRALPLPLGDVCPFCGCDPAGMGVPDHLWPSFA